MTATAQQLRPDLLALPEADRAELAHLLFESLEQPLSDAEERAFDDELARRAEEIRCGRVIGHTPEELFARLDARLDSSGGR
jgi:putative addiction module component (TIGR02574 family)